MKKIIISLGIILCLIGCSNTNTNNEKQREISKNKTVAEKTGFILNVLIASGLYNTYGIDYGEGIVKTKSTTDTKLNSNTQKNKNGDIITHTETTSITKSKSKGLEVGL
ncbi:MAG: hypothetical protein MR673_04185 [Fusobacterium perfoetens]|uniref:hypothetical protein n=1 Tax=Fusobacterium perfoetens TaxID=852 RepID=UPI0023F139C8|nr:hypothetical protein [Fusobacterium perfoetens]MCI6152311.1 hypothetical protein [Fusobacterium perfoetens]MDY3238169.1 hypothetical protein [Fusobacterium perfoetens]